MAQRVVITGAFSYIGSATAGPLLERGFELHTSHQALVRRAEFVPW